MVPYRSSTDSKRPRVQFGDPRRGVLAILTGLALVAASVGVVVAWAHFGGRIFGSVLLPGLLGIFLLVRARWGTIELSREQRLLLVQRGGVCLRRRNQIPLRDVRTVEIVPISTLSKEPDYGLNLVLRDERRVRLRRAGSEPGLEKDRAAIADFFRAHGLLWGGGDPPVESAMGAEKVLVPIIDGADDRVLRR
jgi:hypothetical protein